MEHKAAIWVVIAATLVMSTSPAEAWEGAAFCAVETRAPWEASVEVVRESNVLVAPAFAASSQMCGPDHVTEEDFGPEVAHREIEDDEAQAAFLKAKALIRNEPKQAVLLLDMVAERYPRLADQFAVLQGDALLNAGEPKAALARYRMALESVDSTVRVLSRIGRVKSLILSDHRDAIEALQGLNAKYPELPMEAELRLMLAENRLRAGEIDSAVKLMKKVDLTAPGSPTALKARARLDELRSQGVKVRDYTVLQEVDRAERLVRLGPMDVAREAVKDLLERDTMQASLRSRVYLAAARIAKVEGRFGDARSLTSRARSAAPIDPEDEERVSNQVKDMAAAVADRNVDTAKKRISAIKARRPWTKIPSGGLGQVVRIASRASLSEDVDRSLEILGKRDKLGAGTRMKIAMHAVGTASDVVLAEFLEPVLTHKSRSLKTQANYHYARAMERLGRFGDAKEKYQFVLDFDGATLTPWYAMLARQQLAALPGRQKCHPNCPSAPVKVSEGLAEAGSTPKSPTVAEPKLNELALQLKPLADAHPSLPWIGRAEDFLRLGDSDSAGGALYEAFLAVREAKGRAIRRSGLESVALGANRNSGFTSFKTRAKRRALTDTELGILQSVSSDIGEIGAATGFGGWSAVGERPRAYAKLVEAAAEQHGLDPNLLFAIMRVESVYQRRIVSYAGAIGLTQIMPRTGRLIANAVGKHDYNTSNLLDPELNLNFAAWYLRSLLDRFDGHVPLAVASYNGGPHNVRRWIAGQSKDMPMDAFVEHIPFTQTHRYVRRVLTHYKIYRQQVGLEMIPIALSVPQPSVDPIAF